MKQLTGLLSGGLTLAVLLTSCSGGNTQSSNNVSGDTTGSVSSVRFKKHILTDEFISEGVAVGDVNQDGNIDVMAGAYWFAAPGWERHEIFPGKAFDGAKEYSNSFLNFSMDVNDDGWVDLIVIDFPGKPAHWYENPKNKEGHWKKHSINDAVQVGNESPLLVDVDGDGKKDLLCADVTEKQMVWLKSPKSGTEAWTKYTISEKNAPGTDRFSHGLGFGDINSDGVNDVVIKQGWWQGPGNPTQPAWNFHEADLGEDCAQMQVMDINSDGLNDVISTSAHRYGVWWHEQGKDESGKMFWTQHEVSKAFSQSHSTALVDLNGDGHRDLISGKRFFAHNDTDNDPGAREPAVLCWFEFQPTQDGYFKLHEIDDDSGSGLNLVAEDITNDGSLDIAIANKKGVFVFERQ